MAGAKVNPDLMVRVISIHRKSGKVFRAAIRTPSGEYFIHDKAHKARQDALDTARRLAYELHIPLLKSGDL